MAPAASRASRCTAASAPAARARVGADDEAALGEGAAILAALPPGGLLVALDLRSGRRLWEREAGGGETPAVAGEWLFVMTDDARLMAISRTTGRARWISQLRRYRNEKKRSGAITWFGPVLAGNRLVLVNSEGQIAYANVADGKVAATVDADEAFLDLDAPVARVGFGRVGRVERLVVAEGGRGDDGDQYGNADHGRAVGEVADARDVEDALGHDRDGLDALRAPERPGAGAPGQEPERRHHRSEYRRQSGPSPSRRAPHRASCPVAAGGPPVVRDVGH